MIQEELKQEATRYFEEEISGEPLCQDEVIDWLVRFYNYIENISDKENICKVIKEKELQHRKEYEDFVKANPGYIMNAHQIKADTCKEILILLNYD